MNKHNTFKLDATFVLLGLGLSFFLHCASTPSASTPSASTPSASTPNPDSQAKHSKPLTEEQISLIVGKKCKSDKANLSTECSEKYDKPYLEEDDKDRFPRWISATKHGVDQVWISTGANWCDPCIVLHPKLNTATRERTNQGQVTQYYHVSDEFAAYILTWIRRHLNGPGIDKLSMTDSLPYVLVFKKGKLVDITRGVPTDDYDDE